MNRYQAEDTARIVAKAFVVGSELAGRFADVMDRFDWAYPRPAGQLHTPGRWLGRWWPL